MESRSSSSQFGRNRIIVCVATVFVFSMAARWWSHRLSPDAVSPILVTPARQIQTLSPGEEPRLRVLELRGGVGENDRGKTVVVIVRLVLEGNERVTVDVGHFSRQFLFQCRHAMALTSEHGFEEFTRKDDVLISFIDLPFMFEPFAPIEMAFDCGSPRMEAGRIDETFAMVWINAPRSYDRISQLGRSKKFRSLALKWDDGLGVQPLPKGFPKLTDGITVLPPDGSKPFAVRSQIVEW